MKSPSVCLAGWLLATGCLAANGQGVPQQGVPVQGVPVQGVPQLPAAALPAASLDGDYFARDGHRFLVTGAHWVPAREAMLWPLHFDVASVERDFQRMNALGFNTVRLDLMWAWFEPRPGDYNPEAFAQLDTLVGLAHKYHIYLHPTLFVGGEVGEAWWDVPWRHGRDPQSDPDMLRLQAEHAQALGKRYARETAILAWDLTDEPPFWISANTSDSMAVNWTRLVAGGLRRHDHLHPIVAGVSTQDITHGPFRPDVIADDVDFLSVHPYTIYTPELFPDPMVSERGTYGAAFETALSRGAGRPVMVQEMGASAAQYAPAKIADFDRTSLYSSLAAGANGFLLWCYTDAAPEQYGRVPYLRSPHETQFGLTDWQGTPNVQGLSFQRFEQVAARMDLDGLEPAAGDAGILVPDEWSHVRGDESHFGLTGPEVLPYVSVTEGGAVNGQPANPYEGNQWLMSATLSAFVLAHRAGLQPVLPRERGHWEQLPMLLLPSPLTGTGTLGVHLHTDFWQRARHWVEQGGTLYASLAADAAIPDMAGLFGARMVDSVPVTELMLRIVAPFGGLRTGDTFKFMVPGTGARYWGTGLEVSGGQVIAVDQQGRPALVAHALGHGHTLLSAYPIENWLGNSVMALENDEPAHRLYMALRDWAGVQPLVRTDRASVEAGGLVGKERGYFVLANHSGTTQHAHVVASRPVRGLQRLGAAASEAVASDAAGWRVDLEPWSGAILEWSAP
jgi:hypothetical protein